MSEKTYTADDPRVTAYALDEMDLAERAAFERQLADSPELRAAVEDVRAFSEQLSAELKTEPAPTLTDSQRFGVKSANIALALDTSRPSRRRQVIAIVAGVTVLSLAFGALLLPDVQHARQALKNANSPAAIQLAENGSAWSDSDDAIVMSRDSKLLLGDGEGIRIPRSGDLVHWGLDSAKPESSQQRGRTSVTGSGEAEYLEEFDGKGLSQRDARLRMRFTQSESVGGQGQSSAHGLAPAPDASERPTASPEPGSKRFNRKAGQFGGRMTTLETAPAGPPPAQEPTSAGKQVRVLTSSPERLGQKFDKQAAPTPTAGKPASGGESAQQGQQQTFFNQPNTEVGGFAEEASGEAYNPIVENEFQSPTKAPLSTFSIDVDTASYANVRRFLNHGQWPPADAVRIEELVNYFRYDYPEPEGEHPFSVALEAAACPWNPDHRLVRIGLQGKDFDREQRPPSSLVFLIDVSGSMRPNNKLPLVKDSLTKLVDQMTEDDHIAIVTYAGNAGLVLDSTSGEHKDRILGAINGLGAGGSTNGAGGIQLAYETAIRHFYDKGANRVILCTDGDFNVGISSDNELVSMITDKAKTGVFLSVFGFGMGNLKDAKLEQLADKGNGQYGYIDDQREAYKVFGEELTGTLYTIAKDVKIQVEFNPARVGAYRLIGYENRALAARDFNDDTKDAGEIGAGHRVTALYEIIPPEKLADPPAGVDPLKYQKPAKPQADDAKSSKELLTVKLGYKQPDEDQSTKLEVPLVDPANPKAMPSKEFEFAAAVAAFGMILRDSQFRGQADLELVQELARGNVGDDNNGHRQEFLELVKRAKELQPQR